MAIASLQLKDPSFRRHILVQCLIFFDFLKAPGKTDKEGPTGSMVSPLNDFSDCFPWTVKLRLEHLKLCCYQIFSIHLLLHDCS